MYHTVYLSFEEDGRDYIGKHSTNNPYDGYLGSFKDDTFNPTNKIILEYATTEEGAIKAEMRWQRVFNVVEDPQFANRSYQTSTGFVAGFKKEEHPLFGVKRPEMSGDKNPACRPEVGEKISQKLKGKPRPAIQGDNHYMRREGRAGFGGCGDDNIARRPEVRAVLSAQKQGEGNPAYGRKWWVNKLGERLYQTKCPGEGWQNGRKWKG